jgi:hypothetical protein
LVFQVSVGVHRQHCDPIAWHHAQRLQRRSKSRDAIAEFRETSPALTEQNRRALRMLLQCAVQALGQIHICSPEDLVSPLGQVQDRRRGSSQFNVPFSADS